MGRIRIVHRLDAKPFSSWLEERVVHYGGIKGFAEEVEEDYTWLGKLMHGQFKTVDIDKADSILCHDGTAHLRELYPELYEETG